MLKAERMAPCKQRLAIDVQKLLAKPLGGQPARDNFEHQSIEPLLSLDSQKDRLLPDTQSLERLQSHCRGEIADSIGSICNSSGCGSLLLVSRSHTNRKGMVLYFNEQSAFSLWEHASKTAVSVYALSFIMYLVRERET